VQLYQIPDDYIQWVLREFTEGEKGYVMCKAEWQRREAQRDTEVHETVKYVNGSKLC
jgi:hypothetical protein